MLALMVLEEQIPDLRYRNAAIFCDNTPAMSWAQKKAAKSKIPGRLARGLALHLRHLEMGRYQPISLAGNANDMADVASWSFLSLSKFKFSDAELLTYFDLHFTLSQVGSWTLVTPPSGLSSNVISAI